MSERRMRVGHLNIFLTQHVAFAGFHKHNTSAFPCHRVLKLDFKDSEPKHKGFCHMSFMTLEVSWGITQGVIALMVGANIQNCQCTVLWNNQQVECVF